MTQNKCSSVSCFLSVAQPLQYFDEKIKTQGPRYIPHHRVNSSRASVMTQNTKFQVQYPLCYICDFQILFYWNENLPYLLLPKYYMELQYKTDSDGVGLVETELEAQNPTYWLCLHAILFAIPMTLKILKMSFKITTLKSLKT